jgi:hypothetical protein
MSLTDNRPRVTANHNQSVVLRPVPGVGLTVNHNQTTLRPAPTVKPQHNQTVIRPQPGREINHNQTLVRR